ncbi:hypothetical protein OROHE_003214 [Orobanche hederae]
MGEEDCPEYSTRDSASPRSKSTCWYLGPPVGPAVIELGSRVKISCEKDKSKAWNSTDSKKEAWRPKEPTANIAAQTFTFRELAAATKNFIPECLLGEGGFGRVYKGRLESTGQVVAVKQLDRSGLQGNREFLVEVLMLSLLHHTNLVNLIGYCADGDQRLLVYEYMSLGSLEDHLHDDCQFIYQKKIEAAGQFQELCGFLSSATLLLLLQPPKLSQPPSSSSTA